ncbi:unnamed protein product [Clavelina lepadiformis]|uniref:Uncharacterized protein n=1 Tax=Clavelina lepadiformis TaxID=159417 RepID=A0ABP0F4F7_CLALP
MIKYKGGSDLTNEDDVELSPLIAGDESVQKHKQRRHRFRFKKLKPFPFSIFFILGNEFCERYSYYGMRTILVLYLKYYLHWDDNTATAVYHAFTVLAYLFPLLGAVLADSWWGKYNTILWLSIVYSIGMVINTLGAIGNLGDLTVHAVLSSIGLFVIAVGTGGIKPCVSAFGGDQFDADQDEYRRSFFSLFYFSINAGSLVSTFVSPLIREEVQCFGDDCYALAFGIPAALMLVAIISFVIGTKWYKRIPPSGNIFLEVSKTIWKAWKIRWNTKSSKRNKDHWLDYALHENNDNAILIRDIKYVLNVLVLYIPLPLFWTLFDQQGSRWTLQATRMDGYVGSLHVLPDQMQICNPLMIVCLIPIFEATLYPLLRRYNINFSPLRRMTLGMILAGISFVVAALVQMMIDENLTKTPYNNQETSLRVINSAADCSLLVRSSVYSDWETGEGEGSGIVVGPFPLDPGNATNSVGEMVKPGTFNFNYGCGSLLTSSQDNTVSLAGLKAHDVIFYKDLADSLKYIQKDHRTEKSDSGGAFITVVNTFSVPVFIEVYGVKREIKSGSWADDTGDNGLPDTHRGTYALYVSFDNSTTTRFERKFTLKTGALYTLVLRDSNPTDDIYDDDQLIMDQYTDINPNDVSIFWMIPQYFIITLGEVFLSVTGLEFSYSQAPQSMKSVLQSFWLLTVSIGNIIVLIVAEARLIPKQADEYFLFAGLIGVAAILFIILSVRYKYVDQSEFDDDDSDNDSMRKEDLGKENPTFVHNTEM